MLKTGLKNTCEKKIGIFFFFEISGRGPDFFKTKKKICTPTGGGRINEVIRIKHVRRIKHAFEKWVFCFFLRRIKHVRVLFDFLNFSCVVTR